MKSLSPKEIGRKFLGIFVSNTNEGIWVRILFVFVLVNVIGIAISLFFFLNVRGRTSEVIASPTTIPKADTVNREQIKNVLEAFRRRQTAFNTRASIGVSIPNLYK